MHAYYRDYCWKEGSPLGIGKIPREAPLCYRIVSDPYRKWISVEMYQEGRFASLIYDQMAWRKEPAGDLESWIFNEDDRLILLEKYKEEACEIYSPHGILLCRYRFFKEEGRVELFDSGSRPVMTQHYRAYERGEFHDLIKEEWSPKAAATAS